MDALPGTGEFPRMNPRHVGAKHRFTYGVIANGIARWDLATGKHETFSYGPNTWSEEPVFTPRPGAIDETDGWLTATVLNYGAGRTELAIFDARRVSDGPVTKLACPYALPLGFHGAFVTA
jgi:carotenoid cleavage dioxygenase